MTTELHIHATDPLDVSFWALVLEVSEAAVLRATEEVGEKFCDVSEYLRFPSSCHRDQSSGDGRSG